MEQEIISTTNTFETDLIRLFHGETKDALENTVYEFVGELAEQFSKPFAEGWY